MKRSGRTSPAGPEEAEAVVARERLAGRRIALVYDCLFPYSVGGGERWYRTLAEGLAASGASVTYLTRSQWEEPPGIPGIEVVSVSGRSTLYDENGTRRLAPTVRFGLGLGWWLLRNRKRFDVVQVASFPFWSVLAVRLALVGRPVEVVVDWFELWTAEFWKSYAGSLTGTIGYQVQQLCLRLSPQVVVLSPTNADRLSRLGYRLPPIVLAGFLPERGDQAPPSPPTHTVRRPFVLFVGRHIRDKGVDLLPETIARVRQKDDRIRFVVTGDGPLRSWLESEVDRRGWHDAVEVVGFVSDEVLERLLGQAACVLAPSRREGYGIVVVDAMAKGTPVVTAAFPENLAVDHIEGCNGRVADPPDPENLALGIIDVVESGVALRRSTLHWYAHHAPVENVRCSVEQMVQWYDWRRLAGQSRP